MEPTIYGENAKCANTSFRFRPEPGMRVECDSNPPADAFPI